MKHYNGKVFNDFLQKLKDYKSGDVLYDYYLSNLGLLIPRIPKDYSRIGILNLDDLVQETYYAFQRAWDRVKWDRFKDTDEEEVKKQLWIYFKKSVGNDVKESVRKLMTGIRVPHRQAWKAGNWGLFEDLFPVFFGNFEKDLADGEVTSWKIEQLSYALDNVMDQYLSFDEAQLLKKFYGVDHKKATLRNLCGDFNKSEKALQTMKMRAIRKLRNDDVKNYILNHFNF